MTDTPEVSEIFTVPRRDVGSGGTRRLDVNVIAATVAVAQACQVRAKQDECTPRRLQTANRILGQRRLTTGGGGNRNSSRQPQPAPTIRARCRAVVARTRAAGAGCFFIGLLLGGARNCRGDSLAVCRCQKEGTDRNSKAWAKLACARLRSSPSESPICRAAMYSPTRSV